MLNKIINLKVKDGYKVSDQEHFLHLIGAKVNSVSGNIITATVSDTLMNHLKRKSSFEIVDSLKVEIPKPATKIEVPIPVTSAQAIPTVTSLSFTPTSWKSFTSVTNSVSSTSFAPSITSSSVSIKSA